MSPDIDKWLRELQTHYRESDAVMELKVIELMVEAYRVSAIEDPTTDDFWMALANSRGRRIDELTSQNNELREKVALLEAD